MHQDIFLQNLELNITVDNKSEQLILNSKIFEHKEEIRKKLKHIKTKNKLDFDLDVLDLLEGDKAADILGALQQLEIIVMDKETIDNLVNNSYVTLVFVNKQDQTNKVISISDSTVISLKDFISMLELKGDVVKFVYSSGYTDKMYFDGHFCKIDNNIESVGHIEIKLVVDRMFIIIQNFVMED